MEGSRFNPEGGGEGGWFEHEPKVRSPERKKVKRELKVIVPDDFELKEDNLRDALESIVSGHQPGDSIEELRSRGLDYTGKRVHLLPPGPLFIRAQDIVGTESKNGWSGLVKGVGRVDEHAKPQTLATVLSHAQKIIDMEPDERNGVLSGIELVMGGGKFFVDSDGRHRIFTLKALSELGCDVAIYGMKVGELV